jgi:hypothetical protein
MLIALTFWIPLPNVYLKIALGSIFSIYLRGCLYIGNTCITTIEGEFQENIWHYTDSTTYPLHLTIVRTYTLIELTLPRVLLKGVMTQR